MPYGLCIQQQQQRQRQEHQLTVWTKGVQVSLYACHRMLPSHYQTRMLKISSLTRARRSRVVECFTKPWRSRGRVLNC